MLKVVFRNEVLVTLILLRRLFLLKVFVKCRGSRKAAQAAECP
jgi:hypothetical protein